MSYQSQQSPQEESTPITTAYNLQRTTGNDDYATSVAGDSESYLAIHTYEEASSRITSADSLIVHNSRQLPDATDVVHEMHLALLYLLSHPEEFSRATASATSPRTTTLAQWNAEYDYDEEDDVESLTTAGTTDGGEMLHQHGADGNNRNLPTPLPFVVFADDAEVVLPQAHTASQLFGVERIEGIELEAAAGIASISQLFLRWLALMPSGDHLHIIDPPGLTVMRIAGGRYRVTAAHRVVWTWMNEFAPIGVDNNMNELQVGDLVTMTIVDVFETDNQGKLLSYCPTFDNRSIMKTHPTTESIRRGGSQLLTMLAKAKQSKAAAMIFRNAQSMASSVKNAVDEAVRGTPNRPEMATAPSGMDSIGRVEPATSVVSSYHAAMDGTHERHEV